jgi:chromate reductase
MLGGARAQYHLRQVLVSLNMYLLNKPEVFITFAGQKFDEQGRITDDKTKEFFRALLEALVNWTRRQQV